MFADKTIVNFSKLDINLPKRITLRTRWSSFISGESRANLPSPNHIRNTGFNRYAKFSGLVWNTFINDLGVKSSE